ncbi:MAG: phage late control D family protein [Alphaproteobacteria bacterium]|nr:phage late control D family protein [Alphaproteobacteria bacterium]
MRPIFTVLADGRDVTAAIADRLVSLTVTDEAGWQSDTVDILLDDRDGALAVPATGAELTVSIGYAATGAMALGTYRVDEVEMSGPEMQMRIRAKASDSQDRAAPGKLKGTQSRSWHDTTIGAIVEGIAAEHGLEPVVGGELAGVTVPHLDQNEESDINLLLRLARDNGAVAKVANGKLLFAARGEAKTASGKAMPAIALAPGDVDTWRVTMAERGAAKTVVAQWQDESGAKLTAEKAGAGDPVHTIRHTYPSADQARRAASAKLDQYQRGKSTLELSLSGRPDLAAECALTLSGFRAGVDGAWVTTKVEHKLEDGGYTCSVSAEVPTA